MIKIGVVAQKGGVGSTAAMIGRVYTAAQWKVLLADMDSSQSSLLEWNTFRQNHHIEPALDVRSFERDAYAADYDMVIFDGAPHAAGYRRDRSGGRLGRAPYRLLYHGSTSDQLAYELTEKGLNLHQILRPQPYWKQGRAAGGPAYLTKTGYPITEGGIPEKQLRRAFIEGKTLTEVPYPTLKRNPKRCFSLS